MDLIIRYDPEADVLVVKLREGAAADEELVDYLVKIAIKGGFRVEAPPVFNAVKAREG